MAIQIGPGGAGRVAKALGQIARFRGDIHESALAQTPIKASSLRGWYEDVGDLVAIEIADGHLSRAGFELQTVVGHYLKPLRSTKRQQRLFAGQQQIATT